LHDPGAIGRCADPDAASPLEPDARSAQICPVSIAGDPAAPPGTRRAAPPTSWWPDPLTVAAALVGRVAGSVVAASALATAFAVLAARFAPPGVRFAVVVGTAVVAGFAGALLAGGLQRRSSERRRKGRRVRAGSAPDHRE
jgi:hypothetical protein